jgi:hypothetical protein
VSLVLSGKAVDETEVGLFPKESGRLHISGQHFYTEDNQLWSWRGYSWFLGYRRFLAGDDLTGDLKFFRANGINVVRVFGPLPWTQTPDYRQYNIDMSKLGAFFDLLAQWGIRCEFVPICYEFLLKEQRKIVQAAYDAARGRWNVFIETCNEPHVNGTDPIKIMEGINRNGVLSAYGLYQFYYNKSHPRAFLDYCTIHTTRDSAWARKARHAQELAAEYDIPCISDEPAKICEPDFDYPGGKNDPSLTPQEAAWHFGVLALWTPGGTFHCEDGKWGRVPMAGSLQRRTLEAVVQSVWTRIDPSWQSGHYNGSHLKSSTPVDFIEDVWTYTSLGSKRALSVRIGVGQPEMQARNGWTITSRFGPGNSFATLVR